MYLKKAVWLDEEIAKLFLAVLKGHLKSIQVALGEMDAWLLEASHSLSLINNLFKNAFAAPELASCSQVPGTSTKSNSSICVRCFKSRGSHRYYNGYGRHSFQSCPATNTEGSYLASNCVQIKKIPFALAGDVSLTFNSCSESEQEKLRRFIHFADGGTA